MSEGKSGSLFRFFPLLQLFGRLALIYALFLVSDVGLVEILNSALAHLLAIMGNAELCGPVSYRLGSLLHIGKIVVIHLTDVLVNIDDSARLAEVMVTLAEDRASRFFEALVGGGQPFRRFQLLDHQRLHVQNVRIETL